MKRKFHLGETLISFPDLSLLFRRCRATNQSSTQYSRGTSHQTQSDGIQTGMNSARTSLRRICGPTCRSVRRYSLDHERRQFRMAVIGSGPAGFYTSKRVMSKIDNACVDMYEQLPAPYGLVRFGVAPDHPEVKVWLL